MATYGDDVSYQSLTEASSFAVTLVDNSDIPGLTGYVFDLFQADVSLGVDPSFAAALEGGTGFNAVNAIATFDMSASVFNKLFFITVDSSDIDDVSSSDIIFSIDGSSFEYPFVVNDVSMAFSESVVKYGAVNNQYSDQVLKKDIVRHIAKSITGGYAVADIFSNETALVNDVAVQDAQLHGKLHSAINTLQQGGSYTSASIPDITDDDQRRFFQVARSLFSININDAAGGRQADIYADLSNNSVDGNGNALASATASLKFKPKDAIALRIQYDPKSSPVIGMGNNEIPSRSYKILILLS